MKKLLALFSLLFIFGQAQATHVVGGDIYVEYVSPNTYNLTVRVYKDCGSPVNPNPAGMPTSVTVGLYDFVTDGQINTWIVPNVTADTLELGDPCFKPEDICVMEGIFSMQITIPDNPNGYYLETHLYARNGIIDNITAPGSTGMTFYAEFPDPAIGINSSPDFGPYPADGYLCTSYRKELGFNVTDNDGDSLVYSLVDPLNGPAGNGTVAKPYNPVTWAAPYSLADICGGVPPMDIDPVTGLISAQPSLLGVYVLSVRVEEYRAGVKIGETRRDMQYAALNCAVDSPPLFLGWDDTAVTIQALGTACFDIIVQDPDATDTIYMEFDSDILDNQGGYVTEGDIVQTSPDTLYEYSYVTGGNNFTAQIDANNIVQFPGSGLLYFNEGTVAQRFCWSPDCDHISTTPYEIGVESYSLGCSGSDTTRLNLLVTVVPIQGGLDTVPNVFTPNGDNLNDQFKLDGTFDPCYDFMNVEIYNRWGQKVYESDDPLFAWDGNNLNGKECPAGTYFVIMNGQFGGDDVSNKNVGTIGASGAHTSDKFSVTLFR